MADVVSAVIDDSITITESLNLGYSFSYTLKVDQLSALINQNDVRPLITEKATDVVVMKDGKFFAGGRLANWQPEYASNIRKIKVTVEPYFNFYANQYLSVNFRNTPQGEIAWAMIDACNSKPNGDYNIRRGQFTATIPRDRNEENKQVKDFITRMTKVRQGLDFDITVDDDIFQGRYTKRFNTYDVKGTYHRNVNWVAQDNELITSYGVERDSDIVNSVIAFGSGNGDAAITTTQNDDESQQMYYRQENLVTFNSIVNMQPLIENSQAILDIGACPIEIPQFTFRDGGIDNQLIKVGDTISANVNDMLFDISGQYRIIEKNIRISSTGAETTTVKFDNYSIDDIINGQDED